MRRGTVRPEVTCSEAAPGAGTCLWALIKSRAGDRETRSVPSARPPEGPTLSAGGSSFQVLASSRQGLVSPKEPRRGHPGPPVVVGGRGSKYRLCTVDFISKSVHILRAVQLGSP